MCQLPKAKASITYDWTVCPSHMLKHFAMSYVIKLALPYA